MSGVFEHLDEVVSRLAAVRDELAADVAAMDLDCQLELHVAHAQSSKALLHAAAGAAGLLALSVAGTLAAAWAAAHLAHRLRAGSGPLALWLVGAAWLGRR